MPKTVSHQNLKSYFGQENHLEISQNRSFVSLVFETLSERVPSTEELKVFELILNLSLDHGPETPSAIKTIESARTGKTISQSLAAGILEINDSHGGAIEPAMNIFYQIKDGKEAKELVDEYLAGHRIIAGFGHRLYKDSDPRAQLIIDSLKELEGAGEYINIALDIEKEIEKSKDKKLPLNIDGAIAVTLCTFGWNPKLGKAVFLIARTPGLLAHFLNSSGTNQPIEVDNY